MSRPSFGSYIVNKKTGAVRARQHEIESGRDSFVVGFNRLPKKVRGPRRAYTQEEYNEKVAREATVGS